MRFYVLSEVPDTCLGMRLAGMEGEVISDADQLKTALQRLGDNKGIGIIAITAGVAAMSPHLITEWQLQRRLPLLIEIPDQKDSSDISQLIARHIAETIGVKVV